MLIRLTGVGPIYLQIYSALREAILKRKLTTGSRLPATREIAAELGVSRNVVLMAYERLIAEGYANSQIGSGTYVSAVFPFDLRNKRKSGALGREMLPQLSQYGQRVSSRPKSSAPIDLKQPFKIDCDFQYSLASVDDFPHQLWRRLVARRTRTLSTGYASPEGHASLRGAVADYVRRARGVVCDPDQVLIVNGSQQAIDLTARILLDPGDPIIIEDPQYHGAREIFLSAGARLIPVPVDRNGLRVNDIPKNVRARLAYVTPSHQFPTGAILTLERRLALIGWAEANHAYILEDDYDGEYRYDSGPVESLQGLDNTGHVIYVGTFSKALFPSLRLGYMVLPKALIKAFVEAKWLTDRHTASLPQQLLADFIHEGHFERYLRRARATNSLRREALLSAILKYLPRSVEVFGGSSGVHVLLSLPMVPVEHLPSLVARAAKKGVGVYPATPYYLNDPPMTATLLMGYGSLPEENISEGVKRLAELLNH